MKKRLFLTGPDRSGKSEMIHKALGEKMCRAGGFVTFRERDSEGNILGFDLMAADGSGQRMRFLEFEDGKPVAHPEVFSQTGARLLRQAGNRSFAVLDELGGVELLDDGFLHALGNLLQGDTPCIGVLRGAETTGKAVGMMGLNLRYELARRVLVERLSGDPDTLVLHTTGRDDQEALAQVEAWVAEFAQD